MNITTATFTQDSFTSVYGVWQWDYGQVLRIEGLQLPPVVEVHFSLQEKSGESLIRIGTTQEGRTDVIIPDCMLENEGTVQNYIIYAFLYLAGKEAGQTEKKIAIHVKARPKICGGNDNPNIFHEVVELVNEAVEKTAEHQKQAEGYAHGRDDLPEREEDNAKYYAEEAKNAVKEIPGQVEDAKDEIDAYVKGKEAELKGDTGNVYFAAFKVANGRLKMYSDEEIDKVRFVRVGSRLLYRLNF